MAFYLVGTPLRLWRNMGSVGIQYVYNIFNNVSDGLNRFFCRVFKLSQLLTGVCRLLDYLMINSENDVAMVTSC